MVRRIALLIGCNYVGTKAKLRGCANDVQAEKDMLMDVFNFGEEEIIIMLDSDPNTERPTGVNLRRKFSQLAKWAGPGDVVYIHFSGHGVQIPCRYDCEEDNLDEALVPCDMNVIIDDDLKFIFSYMDPHARLTFVIDCCHSGSMLDHPKQLIQTFRDKSEDSKFYRYLQTNMSVIEDRGMKKEDECAVRGLSLETFADLLARETNQDVDVDHIHQALYRGFGRNASRKTIDTIRPRLWWLLLKKNSINGSRKTLDNQCDFSNRIQRQPSKRERTVQQGILFAGCQDSETSADVAPGGNQDKAYGALTHCLTTIVRHHYLECPVPDGVIPLTNKQLVLKVRRMLTKIGFVQNPSLECTDTDANAFFVQ